MLAGAIVIPGAVAAHDLQQMIDGGLLPAVAEQGHGEIVARLVVIAISLDAGLKPVDLAPVSDRLLGQVEGGPGAGDLGVIGLLVRGAGQRVMGRL